jgi:hypothetical protein
MARLICTTDKSRVPIKHHTIFDAIFESRGAVMGPFTMFMHCPPLAERVMRTGAYIRFEGKADHSMRVLAAMTAAREFRRRLRVGRPDRSGAKAGPSRINHHSDPRPANHRLNARTHLAGVIVGLDDRERTASTKRPEIHHSDRNASRFEVRAGKPSVNPIPVIDEEALLCQEIPDCIVLHTWVSYETKT